ncbi:hypothetical protein C8R45DRAFT_930708 [Mycena sanguinolenta]|nr:hypothetical protein C8R45DRAFT_930708 [Mycena sanguinolenta]
MSAQLQTQHQALQSLAKSVDLVKSERVLTKSHSDITVDLTRTATRSQPKSKPVPITTTPDECILLSLFLVPETKEGVMELTNSLAKWVPAIFPGAKIIPPAVYSHIQIDGIPHAAVPDLAALARELEECHPELGPVVGTPTWVNKPPSDAQTSATIAAGKKPRTAGLIFDSRGSWDPPSRHHEEHGIQSVTRLKPDSNRVPTPQAILQDT